MLDRFLVFGLAFLPLVCAYLIFQIIYFIFSKVSRRLPNGESLLKAIRWPLLFIFLEIGAFISIRIALLPLDIEEIANHILVVLLIATIGWGIASAIRSTYNYVQSNYGSGSLEEFSRRSFATRAQILYRAVMFLVAVVTLAFILMTFPQIKTFGIGILGSAGVAGLAVGLAARPVLLNLIAGFQIAFTRMLKIGDAIVIEGEMGYVEQIFLTHVILKTWDWRRVVIPISFFIDKTYQNWSSTTTEMMPIVHVACDFLAPVSKIRSKFEEILSKTPLWNRAFSKLEVIDLTDQTMRLRMQMTVANPQDAGALQAHVREEIVEFMRKEYPESLPRIRYTTIEEKR